MATGGCNVAYTRKDLPSRKNVEFGNFLRRDGVEGWMPPEKKRKVSGEGWSGKDKEVRISTRNRVVSTDVGAVGFRIGVEQCEKSENLVSKGEVVVNGSVRNGFEDFRDVASKDSLRSRKANGFDGELGQVEGARVGTLKGLTCRWLDESELNGEDDEITCKNLNDEALVLATSDTEMSSPESGEILGGSSGGHGKRSSGRDSGESMTRVVDCSALDQTAVSMEVDDEVRQLDSDSEDCDDSRNRSPEVPRCRGMNMLQGCRSAFEYEKLHKISEGAYGIVYKARDKHTGEIVALKKVKIGKNTEGFPITSLREINILTSLKHPTIVDVREVVMDDHYDVFIVMEYMEHDIKKLMDVMRQPFSQSEVKCLMLQLLEGVKIFHDNWVLHRDLKTSNLLFNNRGELKICDFGMARQYGSPLKPYTSLVVTLWYRAPELLLGSKEYSTAVDMWSVGCIMAEMLAKEVLFQGDTEIKQLSKIFSILGTPNEAIWPGFSSLPGSKANFVKQPYSMLRKKFPAATFTGSPVLTELGFDLLSKLLTYDPEKRITAEEALNHGWFREVPLPKSKEFMPTFPVPYRRVSYKA